MNENTNPEVMTESDVTVEEAAAEETTLIQETEEVKDEETSAATEESGSDEEAKPKKKRLLQIPVIIALCLVLAALLGYFVFTAFFLREPEGITWSADLVMADEESTATYYFEFNKDNSFKAYVGSVEIDSTYQKIKSSEGNTLTVGTTVGNFYADTPAEYEITGSRILGNQTMNYSYGEDYQYTLTQCKREPFELELPADFKADEALLGEWVFQYFGYDIYRVTFNDDGSMQLKFIQDGMTYNGTYTIEDGVVNFTFFVTDTVAAPMEYSVDGDTLSFLGATFVRAGSEATVDQALTIPAN